MKKLKYTALSLGIFIGGSFLFYKLAPVWGAHIDKEQFLEVDNFTKGKFINQHFKAIETTMDVDDESSNWLVKMISPVENREPKEPVKVNELSTNDFKNLKDYDVVWFGHSSFLMKLDGKNILFDPMFSNRPSPVPILIKERYNKNLVIKPEDLPEIDILLYSHDHYDHLDFETVLSLKDKTTHFVVPIGIDQHLKYWGVDEEKITTLEWWQSVDIDGVTVNLTPSQHFSGRRLDANNTLWGSYVIEYDNKNIFFSGDTGYGSHFKEIKDKFGKMDYSFLEAGQYNINWSGIHMMPEHTVQAAIDLGVERFMPVHWGMFTLSTHAWTDPVEKVKHYAKPKGIKVDTPEIGEVFNLEGELKSKEWWKWQE